MVTKLCSSNQSINYHHEGQLHTLNITTRYTEGMSAHLDIDVLADLTKMTIRTWCEAWSAFKHGVDISDNLSAQERLEIEDNLVEPYCTVWNKHDWKAAQGITLTVNSAEKPDYAVIAAHAQQIAIEAIDKSIKQASENKEQADYEDRLTGDPKLYHDENDTTDNEVQAPQESSDNSNADFSNWKHAVFMPDGGVFLPMKKDNEVRMAKRGKTELKYDEVQYSNDEIIAFPFGTIKRDTVGSNELPVISIITGGFGTLNIFCYKRDSEDKTYDYQTIIEYFSRVGIDATADNFMVEHSATIALKMKHSKDGTKEFKNVFGFWNNPI